MVGLLAERDQRTGMRFATRRGRLFHAAAFERFRPDSVTGLWLGNKRTWSVIRMNHHAIAWWLTEGRQTTKLLQQLLGVGRITLFREGQGQTPEARAMNEVRNFVWQAWSGCRIVSHTPDELVLEAPVGEHHHVSMDTMLGKIAPEVKVRFIGWPELTADSTDRA